MHGKMSMHPSLCIWKWMVDLLVAAGAPQKSNTATFLTEYHTIFPSKCEYCDICFHSFIGTSMCSVGFPLSPSLCRSPLQVTAWQTDWDMTAECIHRAETWHHSLLKSAVWSGRVNVKESFSDLWHDPRMLLAYSSTYFICQVDSIMVLCRVDGDHTCVAYCSQVNRLHDINSAKVYHTL